MPKYDYDMIVIGGGAAGLTASTACASVGAKTLLIEKEEQLGGDCLHYGCVPSKSLIKSAYAYHVMRNSTKYGLPQIDVPEVDYQQIACRIKDIINTIQVHDEPGYIKEKYNVETRFGSAKFLDQHAIELDGQKMSSKNFVLAMGSSPAVPPIEGINDVPYITNVEIFSLKKLPKSMIVLGAGPIGMEMAQSFNRFGTKVMVVEFAPHVLPREDEDISETVEAFLQAEGVQCMLSTKGVKVEHKNDTFYLTVERAGQQSTIDAECLLVATGRAPNVNGLDLEKAGVEYDRRGIKVDKRLRTKSKNIYACGDINGSFPFTHVAAYEAGTAMMNAIFHLPLKVNYTNVPWCTYLDPEVASIGLNEKRAKEVGITYTVQREELKSNHRAQAEGETKGFIKLLVNKKGVPIGCQIVGAHAGDLIHEWVAVINGKVSLNTIGNAIHAYPTLSEINKTASFNYFINASFWTKLRLLLNWRCV
ncbi:MAG: FAD-dependent oxidoreductase [Candidatus Omnitrophica bacterium]|nr:FAD-dependent oxidoreductase [Candidatus Omnitrophota bacterium]MCB9747422.1 FAD-dependent oxidoreductase [Candidatus Omnitrophota bacterium]